MLPGRQLSSSTQYHKDQEPKNKRKPEAPFTFDSQAIEEVDLFTYLGSTVSKTGGTDEVVKATINKARQAFAILRAVWRSNNLSCVTKLRQCRQTSSPVRGSGVTKNLDHKLQVFINICLRHILRLLRIGWPERISNQDKNQAGPHHHRHPEQKVEKDQAYPGKEVMTQAKSYSRIRKK